MEEKFKQRKMKNFFTQATSKSVEAAMTIREQFITIVAKY